MKQRFFIMYLLIVCIQLLICNYFHVSAYITLSLLPAAIICMPTRINTTSAMLIAFATGITVDLLAEGVIGLNALALVPVAGLRRFLCDSIFGKELLAVGEDVSMRKYGILKMGFALFIAQSVFLIFYIWADGASARPFSFNLLRFACSLVTGIFLSLFIANTLDPNERK